MLANEQIIKTPTLVWLIVIGMLSFVGAVYFSAIEKADEDLQRAGPNSYSLAATGHKAFVDLLGELKIPVTASRYNSKNKLNPGDALIVAEPNLAANFKPLVDALLGTNNVLLVLPKWHAQPASTTTGWVRDAKLYKPEKLNRFIRDIIPGASLTRPDRMDRVQAGGRNYVAAITFPQLIPRGVIEPIIQTQQGQVLFGRWQSKSGWLWVLSDPDILANHGLKKGDNAALAVFIANTLHRSGGELIIDETAHGFRIEPNFWKLLISRNYLATTVLVLVAIVFVLLIASRRFGKALPGRQGLSPGKQVLIENTAALLEYGGHGQEILEKYLETAIREVAQALRAPPGLDQTELVDWLDQVARSRQLDMHLDDMANQVHRAKKAGHSSRDAQITTGTLIHRWKTEMIHGSGYSTRH
ncbi:MAG: hypothetical protein HQ483_15280 [Rhodospirillales bacterium]|nr:hypothetical protein [Rhodospirillales bacterium]